MIQQILTYLPFIALGLVVADMIYCYGKRKGQEAETEYLKSLERDVLVAQAFYDKHYKQEEVKRKFESECV